MHWDKQTTMTTVSVEFEHYPTGGWKTVTTTYRKQNALWRNVRRFAQNGDMLSCEDKPILV